MLRITDSSKISILATKSTYDLVAGSLSVDISPSKFIGNGVNEIPLVSLLIKDPGGIILGGKSFTNALGANISAQIPTIGGKFKLGEYKVVVSVNDGINTYNDTTIFNLCATSTEPIDFSIGVDCESAKVSVFLNTVPKYKKANASEYAENWAVFYPESDSPVKFSYSPFTASLVEGVNTVIATIVVGYKFPDNVFVKAKYITSVEKKVRCYIDLCHIYEPLHLLREDAEYATGENKAQLTEDVKAAFRLLAMAKIGESNRCDVTDALDELESLLGIEFKCGTGYNRIKPAPLEQTNIDGCGIGRRQEGAIEIFTIDNFQYTVELVGDKGWVKVTNTQDGCNKRIDFDFDWSKLAEGLLERFEGLDNSRFIGILNTELNKVNPKCIDTPPDWSAKGMAAKFEKWLEQVCACCAYYGNVQIMLHCGYASIDTDFVGGVPSSGTITIPVTVTGSGSATFKISTYGITGSLTTIVDESTTQVVIPVTYDGSSLGNDGIKILIPQSFTADDYFDIVLYSDTLPPIPFTITGADLDIDNIYRDARILGRTATIFYQGVNRYLRRIESDLTYPVTEWDYVAQETPESCRQAQVLVTYEGGADDCQICIPVD